MTDTDVAQQVERAGLDEMSRMDIDNVYTLMDVQMLDRPDPRELYKRWEKQNWAAYEIDFTKDKTDWDAFPPDFREQLMLGFRGFFLGEAAVTDTLSPMVHAAPTDSDRQFLSTQLVDEARHTVFFERFFVEVIGEGGLTEARKAADEIGYTADADRGYAKLFYTDLPAVTDAVRLDPGDYGKWVDSIVLYHMLIEGVLALTGQRRLLQLARFFDMLPGFRAGFTAVTRDESRHVNYGVYAMARAVKQGFGDRIVDTAHRYLDQTCDVFSAPFRKIPPIPEQIMEQFPIRAGWEFSMIQLRKRLGAASISSDALDALEKQWWARVDSNLDEYEGRFGEPHPARAA
jgi:ribonucleoside-diphosphate reductase beta chain